MRFLSEDKGALTEHSMFFKGKAEKYTFPTPNGNLTLPVFLGPCKYMCDDRYYVASGFEKKDLLTLLAAFGKDKEIGQIMFDDDAGLYPLVKVGVFLKKNGLADAEKVCVKAFQDAEKKYTNEVRKKNNRYWGD